MLILAGVSLNALVGDNGIVSSAIEATYQQSAAELEEWLQEIYIRCQTNDGNEASTPLMSVKQFKSDVFYNPVYDTTISSAYDYIYYFDSVTNKYYSLYFIKVSGLPTEIKSHIKGGIPIDGFGNMETYAAYLTFSDCYLVSDDLSVEHLDGKLKTTKIIEDADGALKIAYQAGDTWAQTITGNSSNSVTMQEAISKTELEINSDDGITDLSKIFMLSNLKKLTLTNYKGNLKGLSNLSKLTYLYIKNSDGSTNVDYTGIEGADGLTELYFYKPTNSEVEKMCIAMSNTDYVNLNTIGLYGHKESYWGATRYDVDEGNEYRSLLNSLTYLDMLTSKTKLALLSFWCQCNQLESFSGLEDFTNIRNIIACNNNIKDLSSLSNHSFLVRLNLMNNTNTSLSLEPLSTCLRLTSIGLKNNKGVTSLLPLTVTKAVNNIIALNVGDLDFITEPKWTADNKSLLNWLGSISTLQLDAKYDLLFSNKTEVALLDTTEDSEFKQLYGNQYIKKLECSSNKLIKSETWGYVLPSLSNLEALYIDNTAFNDFSAVKNLNNISFVSALGTPAANIEVLFECSSLKGLRINNSSIVIHKDILETDSDDMKEEKENYNKNMAKFISRLTGLRIIGEKFCSL